MYYLLYNDVYYLTCMPDDGYVILHVTSKIPGLFETGQNETGEI